jgi:hypothetical protein
MDTILLPSRHRLRPAATVATLLALAFAAFAAKAGAAPATFPDPGGSGASITISDTEVVPGQRIAISGDGFVPAGGGGYPLVAIKPYDIDPPWAFGGPDAYPGPDDARIWFVAQQPSGGSSRGAFSGWIDVPGDLTPDGLAAGPARGTHWLRILSGAFSTADAVTVPITYKVPFTVVERLTLGLTSFGTPARFQAGTQFRPGASVTARGHGFDAGATVSVTLDGAPLAASITTDAEGALPASARVALPAGTAPGAHTLGFATGAVSAVQAITVTPVPTVALDTPAVRPGGRFALRFRDFTGVAGAGQKVAIVVDEAVLACLQADASGQAVGTAVLPATTALGTATVGFTAGTSCAGPTGAQDDLPAARITAPLTVAATAPAVRVDRSAAAGSAIGASGEAFAPGAAVTVTLDGAAVASGLTVGADGRFDGTVALPAATAPGERTLLFTAGSTRAVATFTATAPLPAAGVPAPPAADGAGTAAPAAIWPAPRVVVVGAPKVKSAAVKGTRLTLTLTGRAARKTAISVRTAGKVRLAARAKARTVTLARTTTSKVGRVTLTLTRDGRRILRRLGKVKVAIRITAPGRPATTRTLTLRRTS